MKLPPPATGVELYLAAIHEVLCDIRAALVDGGRGQTRFVSTIPGVDEEPVGAAVPVDGTGDTTTPTQVGPEPSVTPTKRTRQRPPRGS